DKGVRIEDPDRPYGFTGDAGFACNGAHDILGSDIVVTAETQKEPHHAGLIPVSPKSVGAARSLWESAPCSMRIFRSAAAISSIVRSPSLSCSTIRAYGSVPPFCMVSRTSSRIVFVFDSTTSVA